MSDNTATITEPNYDVAEQAARDLVAKWDDTAASTLAQARAARKLKDSGLKGEEIKDTLKAAIAERDAAELGVTDAHAIAVMAADAKVSVSAVSQLHTALTRAEQANVGKNELATTVKALYRAALGKVKAADLNEVVKSAADLESGRGEYVIERLRALRTEAAGKAADKRAAAAKTETADDVNAAAEVHISKAGAAAYTAAEILMAAERIAADENENGAKIIKAVAVQIVEALAK